MKIFLDCETTGLKDPAVVVLAFAEHQRVPLIFRCRPRKPIELDATVVNGIRNKDVASEPLFADNTHYPWLKKYLEENTIVAHNAPFDVGVLKNEGINVTDWIDTKELARKRWPDAPSHRLQHLYHWLELEGGGDAHTADGDVLTLMALWDALQKPDARPYVAEELSAPRRRSKLPGPARAKGTATDLDRAPRETRREILRKRSAGKKSRSKRAD